jgi:D-alanyl-D-alanine carboxypeptidase/D-alanyl-D-alanine-endopeptidase (penicillin-binding protein 4)
MLRPVFVLLGILALGAVPGAAFAEVPAGGADAAEGQPADAAGVISTEAPAKPPPFDFEAELGPITRDAAFRNSRVGIQVVAVDSGSSVFARDADKALVPASTMKVLTAAAALRALGPAYRFTTDLYADGPVDQAGVLQGNLYVKGHGDPTLVVEKLWKLVYDLRLEGITRIQGDVIFDESYFDAEYPMPGWNKKRDLEIGPSYFATTSALALNFNTVALVVGPGTAVGKPARVQLETPASGYVTIDNQLVTVAAGASRKVELEREVEAGRMTFTLKGRVPADAQADRYYRTVADPTAHFMAAWADLEGVHDIAVTGKHRRGAVPSTATLLVQHRSVPLTAVLMDMNKYSNNFMAEQVLKAIGAETADGPGSTRAGLDYVATYLAGLGLPAASYSLVNGSGLSRDGTLTPSVLTAVMVDMARDEKVGHEFRTTLSIAGWDGTLWRRFTEDPARVRGKTGTIDGVHCLTGYVIGADGQLYAFSFLMNDLRGGTSQAKRLHDRFLRRMFNAGEP